MAPLSIDGDELQLFISAHSNSCRLERVAHRRVLLPVDETRGRHPLGRRSSHHEVRAKFGLLSNNAHNFTNKKISRREENVNGIRLL